MSKISYKNFKDYVLSNKLANLYFLYGDEKYLITHSENAIVKRIVGDKTCDFDFLVMNGEQIDTDKLSVYLDTYPVISKKKCVVIRDINIEILNAEDISDFMNAINDIPEFSTLIISQTSIEFDSIKSSKWKNFIFEFSKIGTVVEFSLKDCAKPQDQIILWAKQNGKKITFKLADMMVRRCGRNLNNLKNETDKLCCFEDSENIKESSVLSIVTESTDSNVFSVCKSLLWGNYSEMYKKLDILFDNNENPIIILSAISSNYIDMFRVKAAIESGQDPYIITKYFDYKKKEFKIGVAVENSRKMNMSQIKDSICVLIEADKKLKSSSLDPKVIINFYITKLICIKEGKY